MSTEVEDPLVRVTQRIVAAAGTAAPASAAASSVFALAGGQAQPDADDDAEAAPGDMTWLERARKTFEACGALSCVQLQDALGCTRSRATALIVELREAREITQVRKDGVVPIYGKPGAAAASGFKGWLGRQAEAPAAAPKAATKAPTKRRGRKPGGMPPPKAAAAPRRPRKARAAAPAPAPAAALPMVFNPSATTATSLVAIPQPVDELQLGIFSDGRIAIEAAGQPPLRLTAAQSRKLLDWALRVDALLTVGI